MYAARVSYPRLDSVGVTPVLAVVLAMAALTDCALRWPAEQNARDDRVVADGDDVVMGT